MPLGQQSRRGEGKKRTVDGRVGAYGPETSLGKRLRHWAEGGRMSAHPLGLCVLFPNCVLWARHLVHRSRVYRKGPHFQESEDCHSKAPKPKEDFHRPGGEQRWKAGVGRGGHSRLRELGKETRGRKTQGLFWKSRGVSLSQLKMVGWGGI